MCVALLAPLAPLTPPNPPKLDTHDTPVFRDLALPLPGRRGGGASGHLLLEGLAAVGLLKERFDAVQLRRVVTRTPQQVAGDLPCVLHRSGGRVGLRPLLLISPLGGAAGVV